jgi:hypothetical protein
MSELNRLLRLNRIASCAVHSKGHTTITSQHDKRLFAGTPHPRDTPWL